MPEPAQRVELIVAGWLRLGVSLAAAVISLGLILLLIGGSPGTPFPVTLREIIAGTLALQPLAIIDFGLLLLIATPVLRVAAALIVYILEGDRDYTVITGVVLLVLLLGLTLGK